MTRESAYLHGMEYQIRAGNWQRGGSKGEKPQPTATPSEEREQAALAERKAANTSDAMLRTQLARLRARQAAAQTNDEPEE